MAQKDKKTKNHEIDDLLKDMELNNEALKEAVENKDNDESMDVLKKMLEETQSSIRRALDILSANNIDTSKFAARVTTRSSPVISATDAEKVIEGVFNGEFIPPGTIKRLSEKTGKNIASRRTTLQNPNSLKGIF